MGTHIDDHSLTELARRIAGADRADDLAQEVRIALLKRRPAGNERAWVIAVLKNMVRQTRRGEARRRRRERVAARPEVVAPVVDGHDVRSAVGNLSEPYRSTITMRYFDGLSSAEIARRQAVPASTARNRLRRALLLLRAMLVLPLLALARRPKPMAAGCVVAWGCLAYAGDEACLPPIGSLSEAPVVSPPSGHEEQRRRLRTPRIPELSSTRSRARVRL